VTKGHKGDRGTKVPIHVLLDAADVTALDRIRRETGESVSGLIRRLVKGFIRSRSPNPGPKAN
jgi:hypothetical protein